MIKKIWKDPVLSQVIAAVILAGIAFIYSILTSDIYLISIAIIVTILGTALAVILVALRLIRYMRQPIRWDSTGYFLGMSAVEGKDIHISSFQVKGYNKSGRHFRQVSGYLVSNITGESIPMLLESMPPEQTNGIPPNCSFWVRALFRDDTTLREGIQSEKFLQRFSDFTFVIELDGEIYKEKFPRNLVAKQISSFWQESNPAPMPAITKKSS